MKNQGVFMSALVEFSMFSRKDNQLLKPLYAMVY